MGYSGRFLCLISQGSLWREIHLPGVLPLFGRPRISRARLADAYRKSPPSIRLTRPYDLVFRYSEQFLFSFCGIFGAKIGRCFLLRYFKLLRPGVPPGHMRRNFQSPFCPMCSRVTRADFFLVICASNSIIVSDGSPLGDPGLLGTRSSKCATQIPSTVFPYVIAGWSGEFLFSGGFAPRTSIIVSDGLSLGGPGLRGTRSRKCATQFPVPDVSRDVLVSRNSLFISRRYIGEISVYNDSKCSRAEQVFRLLPSLICAFRFHMRRLRRPCDIFRNEPW